MNDPGSWFLFFVVMAVAGVAAGFISGLFGVGGGIVRIPIFLYLLPLFGVETGVLVHVAVSTSLAIAIPSNLMSSVTQFQAGRLEVSFLWSWIPSLMLGVVVGIALQHGSPGRLVIVIFAVTMALIGLQMTCGVKPQGGQDQPRGVKVWVSGVGVGGLSSYLGLSGGAFTTPLLTFLGMPIHRAIAVASTGGIFIALEGSLGGIWSGWGHSHLPPYAVGYVSLPTLVAMLPTVTWAARWGVRAASRLSPQRLRLVFGLFVLLVAADLFRQAFAS